MWLPATPQPRRTFRPKLRVAARVITGPHANVGGRDDGPPWRCGWWDSRPLSRGKTPCAWSAKRLAPIPAQDDRRLERGGTCCPGDSGRAGYAGRGPAPSHSAAVKRLLRRSLSSGPRASSPVECPETARRAAAEDRLRELPEEVVWIWSDGLAEPGKSSGSVGTSITILDG